MNRVIKFRGKVKNSNEWKYGSLLTYADGECNIITETGHRIDTWNVAPETVGQYTALKDRNGNDVYEGDIIKSPCDNVVVVEFGYHEDVVQLKGASTLDSFAAYGWIVRNLKNGATGTLDNSFLQGEVIDNIHDTSEMLVKNNQLNSSNEAISKSNPR